MSFLIGNGHVYASKYPLAMVWSEVEMVRRRRNREIKAQAALDKARDVSVHGGKKGSAGFRDAMKGLDDGST